MLAKAIASEFSLNFISVKGPELLNMYIGESERNIRELFQQAIDGRPSILFFDEIDSVIPRKQPQIGTTFSDRIVSQFSMEIDRLTRLSDCFVIGATNRLDLIEPNILRSGRFDKIIELKNHSNMQSKVEVLSSVIKSTNTRINNSFVDEDLENIVNHACKNDSLSGAALTALVNRAINNALQRKILQIEQLFVESTEDNFYKFINFDLPERSLELCLTMKDFFVCDAT